jgi:hypothetical protein
MTQQQIEAIRNTPEYREAAEAAAFLDTIRRAADAAGGAGEVVELEDFTRNGCRRDVR